MRGVINLRGAVLPMAARRCFGASDPTARHVILVKPFSTQTLKEKIEAVFGP